MEGGGDPYRTLNVATTASPSEIKKAYRVLALKYHPDKNKDKPDRVALFHKVVEAYNILTDVKAKAAYDAVLRAKEASRLRDEKLSAAQRKDKHDLEAREAAHHKQRSEGLEEKRRYEQQLQRLRQEGQRRLEEEEARLRTVLAQETAGEPSEASGDHDLGVAVKVRWSVKGVPGENGGYSEAVIRRLFRKYGDVDVAMSSKPGRAVVSYGNADDARLAVECERGLPSNELTKLVRVEGAPGVAPTPPLAVPEDFEGFEAAVLQRMHLAQAAKARG